jgi:hypothetical protein
LANAAGAETAAIAAIAATARAMRVFIDPPPVMVTAAAHCQRDPWKRQGRATEPLCWS